MKSEAEVEDWLRAASVQTSDESWTSIETLFQRIRRRARPLDMRSRRILAIYAMLAIGVYLAAINAVHLSGAHLLVSLVGSAMVTVAMWGMVKKMR